jgi:hypothetical protein
MTRDLRRLIAAPELLVIDLLDTSLETLKRALLVEHPPLASRAALRRIAVSRRARDVLRAARRLRHAIDAYRHAVDQALDDPDDDLPF